MCGFVLLFTGEAGRSNARLAAEMASHIAHRGPDDAGAFDENGVAMAFRRLAIFDLADSSHQPMMSHDERYVIVFNGAIYNFIELRAELASLGRVFRSTGDTEVLLAAYQQWGADCLSRLNGMFAFVVYDRQKRRIFAARDRFGVKPLFWFHDERGLVLTSELKAIRDSGYASLRPNWSVIADFLLEQRLDNTEESFYDKIRRVPAGCYFESDGRSEPVFRRFWTLEGVADSASDESDPVGRFADIFNDAVRIRMRSDVPVGVLLSGGLDSTSIITCMAEHARRDGVGLKQLDALCYQDAAFDERPYIDETIERTGATLSRLEPNEEQLWDTLERHLWHQDEPVHSFTSVVAFQLMQIARDRGVKVLLNGQGADEVLAGYPTYFMDYWSDLVRAGQLKRAHDEIVAFARARGESSGALHRSLATTVIKQLQRWVPGHAELSSRRRRGRVLSNDYVSDDVKKRWVPKDEGHPTSLSEALRFSVERSPLPLFLRVEDRNSMAHAVEVRLPFLDHRLVSFAFRLGAHWKLRGEYAKVVLREAMRGRIAESVRQRATKFGFPTSANEWFRGRLYESCRDVLSSQAIRESGVWNLPQLERALDRHRHGVENFGNRLFDVVQFTAWYSLSGFGSKAPTMPALESPAVVSSIQ